MVSYAIRRANDAISRINHPDHAQRPTLHDLVVVIQDLRTELHIREATEVTTETEHSARCDARCPGEARDLCWGGFCVIEAGHDCKHEFHHPQQGQSA